MTIPANMAHTRKHDTHLPYLIWPRFIDRQAQPASQSDSARLFSDTQDTFLIEKTVCTINIQSIQAKNVQDLRFMATIYDRNPDAAL